MDKKICVLTMLRNDDFYLKKWVEYYGAEFGRENLYIYFDGKDQTVPAFCEGTNTSLEDKIPGKVVELEKQRLDFLSARAAELMEKGYDLAIGVDADEFLVVDPNKGVSLRGYLESQDIKTSISGLGVDVGQLLGYEGNIQADVPFLSQRSYARLSTRYTKPSVIAQPLRWGRGFHRVKGHNYHIAKDLYLFHFGYFDMGRIQARFSDKDRIQSGVKKHLKRRSKTIRMVSTHKARNWDKWTVIARRLQTIFRPPYALNKPAMLEAVIIVRIPERFRQIV